MKGVKKCILSRKSFIISVLFFIPFLALLSVDDSSAVNLNTNTYDLRYRYDSNSSYSWVNGISQGFTSTIPLGSGAGVQKYQFNTSAVQAGGNYAMLHFETNLVATNTRYAFNPWVNLYQQNIITCTTSSGVNITSKNLSWATTQWYNSQYQEYNNTLTFYGSVSMSGFTVGNNYAFTCQIGSDNYSFYDFGTDNAFIWFEQNPAYIEWTNNQTDNILNIQVSQNETIINQNQEIIEQNNQDRSDLQNTSDNAEQSAESAGQQVTQASASLLTIMGNYINIILNPPQTNCELNMSVLFSRYKSGNYGGADLCSLEVPQSWRTPISSVILIGLLIPFVVSTINTFLYLLKGATQD